MGHAQPPAINEKKADELHLYLVMTNGIAVALTSLLAIGFLIEITRFRIWHRSSFLKFLLTFTKSPLVHWIGQFHAFVIDVPYYNELYLVWGVLLFTGFGSFYSMVEYSIYTSNKKELMLMNEKVLLVNNFGTLVLLLYYTLWYTSFRFALGINSEQASAPSPQDIKGHFALILWLIWGFSLMKIVYQIASYCKIDRSYGSAHAEWVSYYMKRPENVQNFDPKTMTGCRYLVVEEKNPKVGSEPNYEIIINDKDLVTVDTVWQSKGWLLNSSGCVGDTLKEACLSFALFKMLQRRFVEECETAEANRLETRDFIRRGLLELPPGKVIGVIDMELRFLRDLFYTKYRAVLKSGLLLQFLHFGIIFTSLFGIFHILNHYKPPYYDLHLTKHGRNKDVTVTKFILFTVTAIQVWEFIHYFCSNWSKVLLVCKYVKYPKFFDHLPINMVFWVFCSIYIPGKTTNQIGQYSLLQSCKSFCCNCCYRPLFSCLGYTARVGRVKYVRLNKVQIMEAILPSLKQFLDTGLNHPMGTITAISRNRINEKLPSWACELQKPIQTVMIWHVATNFCWMINKKAKRQRKEKTNEKVVVTLSNYCAYLVVHAPELLPINTYESELISEQIVCETCDFFQGICSEKKMVETMEKVRDNEETVIGRGARLGKMLKNEIKEGGDLFTFLKEVWVELMLRLAPSETSVAHATKLANGGEFMTYMWVLLYHAGLINQSSFKDGTTSMP
jgi:Domain of unknown function (DUF4220)/Protein of unknown function, DUF594